MLSETLLQAVMRKRLCEGEGLLKLSLAQVHPNSSIKPLNTTCSFWAGHFTAALAKPKRNPEGWSSSSYFEDAPKDTPKARAWMRKERHPHKPVILPCYVILVPGPTEIPGDRLRERFHAPGRCHSSSLPRAGDAEASPCPGILRTSRQQLFAQARSPPTTKMGFPGLGWDEKAAEKPPFSSSLFPLQCREKDFMVCAQHPAQGALISLKPPADTLEPH